MTLPWKKRGEKKDTEDSQVIRGPWPEELENARSYVQTNEVPKTQILFVSGAACNQYGETKDEHEGQPSGQDSALRGHFLIFFSPCIDESCGTGKASHR